MAGYQAPVNFFTFFGNGGSTKTEQGGINMSSNIALQERYIKRIIIENFQSHKLTEIIPGGPGQMTVIVGQSRQGKTAIFRALKWLFNNSPDGEG